MTSPNGATARRGEDRDDVSFIADPMPFGEALARILDRLLGKLDTSVYDADNEDERAETMPGLPSVDDLEEP